MAIINENGEIIIPVSSSEPEPVHETEMNNSAEIEEKTGDESVARVVDQLQRLQAEFTNYKRRIDKERESMAKYGKSELASKLLPILDDLERMIEHHQGEGDLSLEGVQLIYGNLVKVLEEEGLERIPALGDPFDPEIHEAVGVEEAGVEKEGLVTEEWIKGYRFAGKLLRPSRVKVGR